MFNYWKHRCCKSLLKEVRHAFRRYYWKTQKLDIIVHVTRWYWLEVYLDLLDKFRRKTICKMLGHVCGVNTFNKVACKRCGKFLANTLTEWYEISGT